MIYLRPAAYDDAGHLLRWRNEPHTVALSSSRRLVTWKEHTTWLKQKLDNPSCVLLIAQDAFPRGMVRFDGVNSDYEISVAVTPEMRNRGIGKWIVHLALAFVPGSKVIANIREINEASVKVFEANGFAMTGRSSSDMLRYERCVPKMQQAT